MSALLHLCRDCRHRAISHDGGDRGYSGCRCCRGSGDIDPEPVLVQTFRLADGAAEPLHPPGTTWNAGTMHKQQLCGCQRCRAVAAHLLAAGAEADAEADGGVPLSG